MTPKELFASKVKHAEQEAERVRKKKIDKMKAKENDSKRQSTHGSYLETANDLWFQREDSWLQASYEGAPEATWDHSATGRVLLQPWEPEGAPPRYAAAVIPAHPMQGKLNQAHRDELFQ